MSGPPHKWTKYKAMKDVVKGTRFLPFKTPYKEPVRGERFTAEVLMQRVANLGFVLNLVKTDRYYNPSAYQRYHIRTFHVKLEGHGETPKPEEINKIFNTLKQYMMMEKDPTKLIGVHCTHGVNRTGYVICRYMIEKLGMKPQDAMDNFRDARGYPFDHEEYEEALRTLTPSIDEEAEAFHKIGGKIIPRSEELEPELDVDQALLKRRGARQRRMASIGEDANGDDDRRQTRDDQRDNDRRDHDRHRGGRDSERDISYRSRRYGGDENFRGHRERWEASSSIRDRSPVRRDRSPFRRARSHHYTEYEDSEDPPWITKYLGPRSVRPFPRPITGGLSEEEVGRYLGPRTILEEY